MMFLNLFMAILTSKKIGVATLLVMINATVVQAQEINSYEDFKLYCSDAAYQYNVASPYCDDSKPYYQEQIQEELNRQQNVNTKETEVERREAKRKQNEVSGYAGGALGIFFPDKDDTDTGFGESLFVGGRWNKYLATDIETIYFSGGGELFSPDYFAWALTINPRLIIPFNNNYNSASIYISPGLGVSVVGAYDDDREEYEELETDLAWQIKAGFTIPIQERFNLFLQGRYVSQIGEDANNAFGTQIGFSVNFQ
jgi:hypothetical protein